MQIQTKELFLANNKNASLCIYNFETLSGSEAAFIRTEVEKNITRGYANIYIDAKDAEEADLSGINEVIHTNFIAAQNNLQLVFVYRKQSAVEKWVQTTGLDKFVATAILNAS
jgi:uncharacterized protein YicC (UPF0701 family)